MTERELVVVDVDTLDELVDTARGDLERLVTCDGYQCGDPVVDDLVHTIAKAEYALATTTEESTGGDQQ